MIIVITILAALIGDYFVSGWRADQAVSKSAATTAKAQRQALAAIQRAEQEAIAASIAQSNHQLCGVVSLVTSAPVPKPPNPGANPSRVSSYQFYEAFVTLGKEYRCLLATGQTMQYTVPEQTQETACQ